MCRASKNVWTSRQGMEYAWFNNVETKPGIGYPKDWENQERWLVGLDPSISRRHQRPGLPLYAYGPTASIVSSH